MTTCNGEIDNPRRKLLVGLLTSGMFTAGSLLIPCRAVQAEILGKIPTQLAAGRSIYKMGGQVLVDGQVASMSTFISANARIETGDDSYVIFVVGKDAFILRSNSSLQLAAQDGPGLSEKIKETSISVMRLVTGKLLSVFGKRQHRITTAVATIGIRGTGVYIESDAEESYVCTCYGTADLSANSAPGNTETIVSTHHNAPRYISATGASGKLIRPAPFKNHDDDELLLIETLVGRSTPFAVADGLRSRSRGY